MRPIRLTALTALVAAAILGLGACGAGSAPSTAPPQSAPAASSASSDMSSMPAMTDTGGASTSGSAGSAAPASAAQVVIQNFSYKLAGPVQPGSTVTVRNDDNVAHTVTSDTAGQFDVTIQAHGTATFTAPQTAGSYPIHCTFHPNMHGDLVVR